MPGWRHRRRLENAIRYAISLSLSRGLKSVYPTLSPPGARPQPWRGPLVRRCPESESVDDERHWDASLIVAPPHPGSTPAKGTRSTPSLILRWYDVRPRFRTVPTLPSYGPGSTTRAAAPTPRTVSVRPCWMAANSAR